MYMKVMEIEIRRVKNGIKIKNGMSIKDMLIVGDTLYFTDGLGVAYRYILASHILRYKLMHLNAVKHSVVVLYLDGDSDKIVDIKLKKHMRKEFKYNKLKRILDRVKCILK